MALTTYSELKAAVANWLNRADLDTTIEDFIRLADARICRAVRSRTVAEESLALTTGSVTLPADVQTLRSARLDRTGHAAPMAQVTLEELFDQRDLYFGTAGVPQYYAIADGVLYVAPAPDQAYTLKLSYYAKPTPLSDADPSNWLLASHPDLYLYGALCESAPLLQEDERLAVWQGRFDAIVFEVNREYERSELGANLRTPRLSRVF